MKNGLFIFRRDLRIEDNIGLISASKQCDEKLYCCFIFTSEQITNQNHYKSDTAVKFMMESLIDLDNSLKSRGGELLCFYGKNQDIIPVLIKELQIDGVFFNQDFTPYARERDNSIYQNCKKMGVNCEMFHDYYLYKPGTILSGSGNVYKKFKPFYDKVLPLEVSKIGEQRIKNVFEKTTKQLKNHIGLKNAIQRFSINNTNTMILGGRKEGLQVLKTTKTTQKNYKNTRDIFNKNTSLLSAYLKFGCVSVREVYWMFRKEFGVHSEILRQLIWREFYAHILYAEPDMINSRKNNKYGIKWNQNRRWFQLWCEGKTGFPIVDAAMRQLNTTGWMHNRGRLVVSIFLVKVLLIDWRWGEQYFAKKLVDYDIASNNGNWQWVASTGADNMPFFRTMNPWTQAIEHDPDCSYIKKWIPELKNVDNDIIHHWYEKYNKDIWYKPIVDFGEQRLKSLALYRKYI
jgi:deoxyribodipyrimidine photo-lyase